MRRPPSWPSLAADRLTDRLKGQPAAFSRRSAVPDGGAFFEKNALLFLPVGGARPDARAAPAGRPVRVDAGPRPELARIVAGDAGGDDRGAREADCPWIRWRRCSTGSRKTFEDALAGRPATFSWQEMLTNEKSKPGDLRKVRRYPPEAGLQRARARQAGDRCGAPGRGRGQARARITRRACG
jgi:hypothetical protein